MKNWQSLALAVYQQIYFTNEYANVGLDEVSDIALHITYVDWLSSKDDNLPVAGYANFLVC